MKKVLIAMFFILAGAGVIPGYAHAGDYEIPEKDLIVSSGFAEAEKALRYEVFISDNIYMIRGQFRGHCDSCPVKEKRFIFYSAYEPDTGLYVFATAENNAKGVPRIYREGLTVPDMIHQISTEAGDKPTAFDISGKGPGGNSFGYNLEELKLTADNTLPLLYGNARYYGLSVYVLPAALREELQRVISRSEGADINKTVRTVISREGAVDLSKREKIQRIVSKLAMPRNPGKVFLNFATSILFQRRATEDNYASIDVHEMIIRVVTGLKEAGVQAEIKEAVKVPDYLNTE